MSAARAPSTRTLDFEGGVPAFDGRAARFVTHYVSVQAKTVKYRTINAAASN
jgi:hypothetical protein